MTTALVTGASSGIGRDLARLLAADGHDLVLAARSEGPLHDLADELGGARVVVVDLGRPDGPATLVAALPEVDVLVNNAGVGDFAAFADADPAKLAVMMQLNMVSLTELMRHYLPGMVERGSGRVLNVASTASFVPGPLMAVYYATKAYVLSLTEAVAEEHRGTGVTLTALCPGPTASGFQAGAAMESSKLVAGRKLPSSAEVAAAGYRALQRGTVIEVPGFANKLSAASGRVTPRSVTRRVVHRMQQAS